MSTVISLLTKYAAKTFPNLRGLKGITPVEVEEHLKLYGGYVNNTNLLRGKMGLMVETKQAGTPEFSELARRMGFEYNGMRLHELYFENLAGTQRNPSSHLKTTIEDSFGSWENWQTEFRAMAAMRGVGWVVLYKDQEWGLMVNQWIGMHDEGSLIGLTPILVMDVLEHAWTGYLRPTERAEYIADFFSNIDWEVVERRLG